MSHESRTVEHDIKGSSHDAAVYSLMASLGSTTTMFHIRSQQAQQEAKRYTPIMHTARFKASFRLPETQSTHQCPNCSCRSPHIGVSSPMRTCLESVKDQKRWYMLTIEFSQGACRSTYQIWSVASLNGKWPIDATPQVFNCSNRKFA